MYSFLSCAFNKNARQTVLFAVRLGYKRTVKFCARAHLQSFISYSLCRIKVHMDLQSDKSFVVVKGPFFP
jgi:hypothetical protein